MTNVPTDRACAAAMRARRLSAVGRSVAVKHSRTCGPAGSRCDARSQLRESCGRQCRPQQRHAQRRAQHARCTTRTAARDVHEAAARPIRAAQTSEGDGGHWERADSIRRGLSAQPPPRTHCFMRHAVSRDAEARKAVRRMREHCPRRHRRRSALGRRRRRSPGSRATRHSRRRHPAAQRSAFSDSRAIEMAAAPQDGIGLSVRAKAESDR